MFFIKETKKLQLYKTVNVEQIEKLQQQYSEGESAERDLFWSYYELIFNQVPLPKNNTDEIFWNKLTKQQQVIWVLAILTRETDNGGIWQFFFNQTLYVAAAGVALETLGWIHSIRYEKPYIEFINMLKNGEYQRISAVWNDGQLPFEERWAAFKSGEAHIPTHKEYEDFFYSPDTKKKYYGEINKYIGQHLGKLIVVEGGTTIKEIDKKEAIPHFTQYLTDFYGVAPQEVSIYYRAAVTIKNKGTNLFLMHFKMPDGFESIGITGFFTHHFHDIDMVDIKGLWQRFHKQLLVNIYHGWYMAHKELEKNPAAADVDQKEWETMLAKIQQGHKTQVPVNVTFSESFALGDSKLYIYTGDLLYTNKKPLPADLANVVFSSGKTATPQDNVGEINLIFTTTYSEDPDFGGRRSNEKASIETKKVLYNFIGRSHKLLKDNPWN